MALSISTIRNLDLRPSRPYPLNQTQETARSAQYAAAKTNRLTGDWAPVDSTVNNIIRASSHMVRTRVRQLVRDFPYFARAVNMMVDYSVGPGIKFQSRVKKRNGKPDVAKNQQIEDAFAFWADEADAAGKMHFYELMRLAKRQDTEPGEFLLVKKFHNDKSRYLPFCLQIYEPDWLTNLNDTFDPSSMPSIQPLSKTAQQRPHICQGIEYDPSTGERVAYHFLDPDAWGTSVRIPAENIIHGFEMLRPGQLRGISPFAPGVLLCADLQTMMDAEIDTAKMASKYLAMVKTPDPVGRQQSLGLGADTETGLPIEEMQNAIIEYLRPGEDITIASNPRPGNNFIPFVRLILTMFAVTTGVPYEMISGDYQGMNFSVGKMVRNDFSQQLKSIVNRHVHQFCVPISRSFFDSAVLAGRLNLPGYWKNPYQYFKTEWQPPGMESIDPLKDTKAWIDQINARIRSPQEIIIGRGRDPEVVIREIAEFEKMCKAEGITPGEAVSTAMANNTASVMNQA